MSVIPSGDYVTRVLDAPRNQRLVHNCCSPSYHSSPFPSTMSGGLEDVLTNQPVVIDNVRVKLASTCSVTRLTPNRLSGVT